MMFVLALILGVLSGVASYWLSGLGRGIIPDGMFYGPGISFAVACMVYFSVRSKFKKGLIYLFISPIAYFLSVFVFFQIGQGSEGFFAAFFIAGALGAIILSLGITPSFVEFFLFLIIGIIGATPFVLGDIKNENTTLIGFIVWQTLVILYMDYLVRKKLKESRI